MKGLILTGLLIWGLGCGDQSEKDNPTSPTGGAAVTAAFADTSLEGAVRQALKRSVGALRAQDLAGLGELEARGRGIASLQGIGQLPNLTRLDLADNRIEDLAPLASLSKLQYLDLDNNQVRDLSVLARLSQLEVVVLGHNQVQDLSPLLGLSHLKSAELSGNPLNGGVENAQLATLQEKGVEVSFQTGVTPPGDQADTQPSGPVFRLAAVMGAIQDRYDIFLVKTDGSEPVNLTNQPDAYSHINWSPDGTQLAFVAKGDPYVQGGDIWAMRAEGSTRQQLTFRPGQYYGGLSWSPDGTRIVCGYLAGIGVIPVSGGEMTSIYKGYATGPAWSPEGTRIAFLKYVREAELDIPGRKYGSTQLWDIWTVAADAPDDTLRLSDQPGDIQGLAWSPDGTRIAYMQWEIRDKIRQPPDIYLIELGGGPALNLTNSPEGEWAPTWSPDGTRIAFVSDREGNAEIYVMNADGSNPINLSRQPDSDWYPQWSADGQSLAYLSFPLSGGAVLCLVDMVEGHRTELLNQEGIYPRPGFAGDPVDFAGKYLAWAPR